MTHPLGPSPERTEDFDTLVSVARTFLKNADQPTMVVRSVVDCLVEASYAWLSSIGAIGLIPAHILYPPDEDPLKSKAMGEVLNAITGNETEEEIDQMLRERGLL